MSSPSNLRNQTHSHGSNRKGVTSSNQCFVASPSIYILDCGCWCKLGNKLNMTFGAISGSHLILAEITRKSARIQNAMTDNTMVNKLLSISFSTTDGDYAVLIDRIIKVKPMTQAECESSDSILCSDRKLYIFIPDLHICQGENDVCDFHNADYGASRILAKFLEQCQKNKFTIVQTGDMLDIWMAEASVYNYYKKIDTRMIQSPSDAYVLEGRPHRLRKSANRILSRILSSRYRDDIENIFAKIDYYILGNHDWEIKLPESDMLATFLRDYKINIHDSTHPWGGPSRNEKFHVIHGHQFDGYNNTGSVTNVNDAMKIKGKPLTFSFARYIRHVIPVINDPDDILIFKGLETREDGAIEEQSAYMRILRTNDDDDPVNDPDDDSYKGYLMEYFGSVRKIEPLLEIAESKNFGENRDNILNDVLNNIATRNKMQFKLENPKDDSFFASERLARFSIRDQTICKPLILPEIRVVVHSHTHHAMLTTLEISPRA